MDQLSLFSQSEVTKSKMGEAMSEVDDRIAAALESIAASLEKIANPEYVVDENVSDVVKRVTGPMARGFYDPHGRV